ncbi:putative nucleotidyltransferase/HEPN domain-containing protein [Dysgonomonas hofstadii]|uniref:Putative nucleotidyltransferase/HEPN domain-containing protein n=1 Tax=Dysgonomonas hofstadii TaxID=637886 RepID=A0A840CYR7_9BACT|nr:HEPN domain-containing protein [Dysgonomonas hofstadii]MBB4037083.1 putative nucleotidyltransferase/HEPN domain-containing protein [Dysgonomonas hofstadii]
MKKSISYLPKEKQEDLNYLIKAVLEKIPETQMIILFGSYARNEYVDYDERMEFGIKTTKISDYDILVVTHGISDKLAGSRLDNIDDKYYTKPETQTPVQFLNEDIKNLNKAIEEGRYFYTQIKEEGIMLYDNKKSKLARKRKLNYAEIKQQAEEYFNEKYNRANEFLIDASNSYNRNSFVQSSFYLHQACENYYYAIRLVFTLKSNKQHNLSKLSSSVKSYSPDLANVFPLHPTEEKRLFDLIKAAYVEARYNPKFIVTKEDIDALIPKVELLRDITKRICEGKIREYGEK